MINSLENFAARGRAAQTAADEIISAIKAVMVTAKPDVAVCRIYSSEPIQCPLCDKLVTGSHRCKKKAFK